MKKETFFTGHLYDRLLILTFVLLTGFFLCGNMVRAKALKLNFNRIAHMPSSNIVSDPEKFYGAQGTAFDTYTGKDGYAIAESKLSGYNKLAIVHYQHSENGIVILKKVVYTKAMLDHANDATIYKQGGEKYLFVARGGHGNKTACMIKLSDYNKGIAKVYKVSFAKLDTKSGSDFRGITYVGKKKIRIGKKTVAKQMFVVEVGMRLNLVYLKKINGSGASFVTVDSQRFAAPKIGKRECTAQGVTYHHGQLYIPFGDEGKGGTKKTGKIARIGYAAAFKNTDTNKLVTLPYIWTRTPGGEYVPEAVYFTSLEGKGQLYLTTNEISASNTLENYDGLYRTTGKY